METNNERRSAKKVDPTENKDPIHVIREGAVAASIWKRQSPSGFPYYDYSLSRSWKSMSSGKTGYSKNFFDKNRENLIKVVGEVSRWIEENTPADASGLKGKTESHGDGSSGVYE